MTELHRSTSAALMDLMDASWHLADMANDQARVGNDRVAQDLHALSGVVMAAKDTIRNNDGESLGLQIREQEQSTHVMVTAAIAAIAQRAN